MLWLRVRRPEVSRLPPAAQREERPEQLPCPQGEPQVGNGQFKSSVALGTLTSDAGLGPSKQGPFHSVVSMSLSLPLYRGRAHSLSPDEALQGVQNTAPRFDVLTVLS